MNIENELKKPFPEPAIHWRIGSSNKRKVQRETGDQNAKATKGLPLAYIDARDVMDRLDFVFGLGNWQTRYFETPKGRVMCELSCLINHEWITKTDGAGDTGTEGEKGAISDALKRAAVSFGIGRYLYGLKAEWVDLDQYGKFKPPAIPQWATPNGYGRITASEKKEVYEQSIKCLSEGDEHGLKEIWDEYDSGEKVQLWHIFDSKQRTAMKELK